MAEKALVMGGTMGPLAHDLNNMFAAIIGSVSLIEMKAGDPARHAQNIQSTIRRGTRLLQQLLALSERLDGPFQPVRPAELLGELAVNCREALPPQCSLSVFAEDGLPALNADRTQLLAALAGLVENARDAMPQGGAILVTAKFAPAAGDQKEDAIALTVHDPGTGIPVEIRDQVFEPFFTTKSRGKHAGLGLTVLLRAMLRHGGRVRLESETGKGTAVTCLFPCRR